LIKTALLIIVLVLMFLDLLFVVFAKFFVSGLKSQDIHKRIKAEDLYSKLSLISYLAFFGLLIILVLVVKLL
jgi:hypothetical protein